ncbi:hypothetical protein BAUCODRAFT_45614, partial [Baudoinia panamericana UAMH 10762]
PVQSDVLLSDLTGNGIAPPINIFAGLIRNVSSVLTRLADADSRSIILTPSDGVMSRLTWKDPETLSDFVKAHVVTVSPPWQEGKTAVTMLGNKVWWEIWSDEIGYGVFVRPAGATLGKTLSRVANGEVWEIGGMLH